MSKVFKDVNLNSLLAQVGRGSKSAFSDLYIHTHMKLFGIILRILRQRELSEDVLQDVYVKIWERASDFEQGRASPITWMATIARNRALDVVRKRLPNIVDNVSDITSIQDQKISPEEQVNISEELKRLEVCLDKLDDNRRAVVKLAYLDGLSRQQLSENFGLPVGTIKTWLHRSLKQLKDCLAL